MALEAFSGGKAESTMPHHEYFALREQILKPNRTEHLLKNGRVDGNVSCG